VAAHANVNIAGGMLTELVGKVEYAPKVQDAHLKRLIIDDIAVDYTHGGPENTPEVKAVKKAAEGVAEEPVVAVRLDQFTVRRATLGYVERAIQRISTVSGLDDHRRARRLNASDAGPSHVSVGQLHGRGQRMARRDGVARPQDPQLDMATQLRTCPCGQ
jgi:hypothetical protein